MMNRIIKLVKVFLKTSIKTNNNEQKQEKISKKVITGVGATILLLYVVSIFGFLSYELIKLLIDFNQESMFLGLFMLAIAALVIFQTIFSSINLFYFSKDIPTLLPLPIKPSELLIAKFITLIITEYIIEIAFGLAPIIIYGILTGAGILFFVYAFLVLLIFPIFPAIVATLIVMIIMRFARLTKYKDRFQFIAGFLSIILAIGIQFVVNQINEPTNEELVQSLTKANGMVEIINRYFISIEPTVNTLINSENIVGLIEFLKLLGITIFGVLIFVLLGSKIYLKGIIGNYTGGISGKKKKTNIKNIYKKNEASTTYFLKEVKTLFRNPIYFMQCILPSILMPVILVLSIYLSSDGHILQELNFNVENSMALCIIIAIINFLFTMNFIAITAISRDGENAVFMKYIPISLYKQLIYKIMPGVILNIIPTLLTLVIVKVIFSDVTLTYIGIIFVISFIMNYLQSELLIVVDLKRPKLHWSTEYAVVKQNMNMMFEFILTFLFIGIVIAIGIFASKLNYIYTGIILIILFGTITFIVSKYMNKNQEKLFEKIN